jgi:hypothetical protein
MEPVTQYKMLYRISPYLITIDVKYVYSFSELIQLQV